MEEARTTERKDACIQGENRFSPLVLLVGLLTLMPFRTPRCLGSFAEAGQLENQPDEVQEHVRQRKCGWCTFHLVVAGRLGPGATD